MNKNYSIIGLIAILLLTLLLLLLVSVKFLQDRSSEKIKENISEEIENIPAEVKNLNTLKNISPNFKIGKIYEYNVVFPSVFLSSQQSNANNHNIKVSDKYYIKGIERFNKSNCFIILKNLTMYKQNQLIEKEEKTACIGEDGVALYFSEKDELISMGGWNNTYYGENASKFLELSSLLGKFIYGKWMLNLNDGYKDTFTINFTRNKKEITFKKGTPEIKGIPVDEEYKISVKVDGKEKIHNRECFKVEVKITIKSEDKIDEEYFRNILWIDVEDRVLIKALIYVGIPPVILAEIEPIKIKE